MRRNEYVREDWAFDDFGIDRVTLRLHLTDVAEDEASDAEVVERLEERPVPRLGVVSLRDQRVLLRSAVRDERALMALGEALGPDADPRYLARTWQRASLSELWRQLEELASLAEAAAQRAREIVGRRYDLDADSEPLSWSESRRLVRETEDAWAAARRIAYTVRNVAHPMAEWAPDGDWRGTDEEHTDG